MDNANRVRRIALAVLTVIPATDAVQALNSMPTTIASALEKLFSTILQKNVSSAPITVRNALTLTLAKDAKRISN